MRSSLLRRQKAAPGADKEATLGIESAVFAGHDLGGGVAQIAAVRHPGLCRGLFLTNAIGYDSWPIPSVKALQATAPLVRRLPDVAARPPASRCRHSADSPHAHGSRP